jgi:[protein-PII] uridylyltransferase
MERERAQAGSEVAAELAAALSQSTEEATAAADPLPAWKKRLEALRSPDLGRLPGREAGRRLSEALEEILREVFGHCLKTSPLEGAPRFSLLALGSLGRRELSVRSDVDLLFLADALEPAERAFVERFYRTLWDIGLQLGAGVRTLAECGDALGRDIKTATSLINARWLAASAEPARELMALVESELRGLKREWFIRERLSRRRDRHAKADAAERVREPNIKDGRGGLRDLHDALWIGWAVAGARTLEDLERLGYVSAEDRRLAEQAADFLPRLRNCLHLRRGREWDQLTAEDRVALAPGMDYAPRDEMLLEEQLARDCFLHLRTLARVSDEMLRRLLPAASSATERPSSGSWAALPEEKRDGSLFAPFVAMAAGDPPPTPEERATLRERLTGLDLEAFRRDPARRDDFLKILGARGRTAAALRAMSDAGVLAAWLPEFGKLCALARDDNYHRYTVDEHTLRALEAAEAILAEDPAQGLAGSHVSKVARQIQRWDLLMFALLLHDIGKGEGRGHALRGAQIVRRVAARIGLSEADADVVHFLVIQHLKMSHVAQRRDMSDPKVMRDMAAAAGTPERLDLLYVHTCADMMAVAPGVWNAWKAQLLFECHERTRRVLEADGAVPPEEDFQAPEGYAERVRELLSSDGFAESAALLDRLLERFPPGYFRFAPPEAVARHVELMAARSDREPLVWRLENHGDLGHTDLFLCGPDQPGLLRLVCRGLASRNIGVQQARACATDDGVVIDWLQISFKGAPLPLSMDLEKLRARLNAILRGETGEDEALGPLPPLEPSDPQREAVAPTVVSVDNDSSDRCTLIEFKTSDRPGLLARVCDLLANQFGLFIHQALISTEAYRVVDVFYVTDLDNEKLADARRIKKLIEAGEALLKGLPSGSKSAPAEKC